MRIFAQVVLALAIVVSCAGCPRICSAPPSSGVSPATPPPANSVAPPAAVSPVAGASQSALAAACNAQCGGPLAQLRIYRDAAGAVQRIEMNGSPGRCSHPPSIFFDASGSQIGALAQVPVIVGSPEQLAMAEERRRHTLGLASNETVPCRRILGTAP